MKSGYGLDVENELKLLNVGNRLSGFDALPSLEQTWLGAHDIPSGESEKNYVDELISTQLPSVMWIPGLLCILYQVFQATQFYFCFFISTPIS